MELGNPGIPAPAFVPGVQYREMGTGEARVAIAHVPSLPDFQDGRKAHNRFSALAVAWTWGTLLLGTLL